MSHLVCNGELTKTRRNCLRCSWTSASSAWVFLRRSWVTHKLQKIAPQLFSWQVGGVAILLMLQYAFGILKSLAFWISVAQQPPFSPKTSLKVQKNVQYVKALNHCWSFPLGFLPHIESTLPQGKNPMPRLWSAWPYAELTNLCGAN